MSEPVLLSRPIPVATIPAEGLKVDVVATDEERAAIAGAFGLLELRRLSAELTLERGKRDVIGLDGRLTAELTQACVVTLVPVVQAIDEAMQRRFVPEDDAARATAEIVVDPEADEPPDTYAGGRIDVGAAIVEELALRIDPYPRAPGAELPEEAAADQPNPEDSPFAALAGMKLHRDH